jgi:hypothetical protein
MPKMAQIYGTFYDKKKQLKLGSRQKIFFFFEIFFLKNGYFFLPKFNIYLFF